MTTIARATIAVVVPSIPTRQKMLSRAVDSVIRQYRAPEQIIIVSDNTGKGGPATRQAGLDMVTTDLVAFLDDDDELLPDHLSALEHTLITTGADLVYPWFWVIGGMDPFPQWFQQPWNNDEPHQTTVTFLARTEVLRECGGFVDVGDGPDVGTDPGGHRAGEEYRLVLRLAEGGYKIVHHPEKTWNWYHHGSNTMGLPSRWMPVQ